MSHTTQTKHIVVGVSGASGAPYAVRLIECLVSGGAAVHLIVTPYGRRLMRDELQMAEVDAATLIGKESDLLTIHPCGDVGNVLASGSFRTDGMIICPCSSNTMASVAAGVANNLLTRAAAVTLKESRRLILVPREMPASRIDLVNMVRLSEAGAIICPASPGFYMLPTSVADLVDFVVGKLLDLVDVPHSLNTRWADQLHSKTASPSSEPGS